MSTLQIGVGTSASWKIFFAPDLVEYRCYLEGSPHRIGMANLMDSLISSMEAVPGTMKAYLPWIKFLIFLKVLGL